MNENVHKVPKRQWKRWSLAARWAFNDLYEHMTLDPNNFLHPKTSCPPAKEWNTTAWNAAWESADFVNALQIR